MISKTAIGSINDLKAKGLDPTPEDIIRLNALGLKLEASRKKYSTSLNSLDYLPRVAAISPTISFRQPTIGHEIWIERVSRLAEKTYETDLAVKAFALSRQASELPDPDDPISVTKAIEDFSKKFAEYTRDQIYAALEYVVFGSSQLVGEFAARRETDEERIPDGCEDEDWSLCISLGVLNEGRACLWGINQKELENMTRRQLDDLIRRASEFHNIVMEPESERRCEDFYTTLDVIEERLKKEKKENG